MKMQDRLRAKGFVVVGIDEIETLEAVSAHARRLGMNYPVLLDTDAGHFRKYGGRSLPSAFLIDEKGNIRGHWDGFDAATGLDVEAATYRLLGEKPRF
jgi:peroxiredoxin